MMVLKILTHYNNVYSRQSVHVVALRYMEVLS